MTVEQSQKKAAKEAKEKEKFAAQYAEEKAKNHADESRNTELIDIIKPKFPDADDDVKAKVKAIMQQYDIPNFKENDVSTKGLEEIVAIL